MVIHPVYTIILYDLFSCSFLNILYSFIHVKWSTNALCSIHLYLVFFFIWKSAEIFHTVLKFYMQIIEIFNFQMFLELLPIFLVILICEAQGIFLINYTFQNLTENLSICTFVSFYDFSSLNLFLLFAMHVIEWCIIYSKTKSNVISICMFLQYWF